MEYGCRHDDEHPAVLAICCQGRHGDIDDVYDDDLHVSDYDFRHHDDRPVPPHPHASFAYFNADESYAYQFVQAGTREGEGDRGDAASVPMMDVTYAAHYMENLFHGRLSFGKLHASGFSAMQNGHHWESCHDRAASVLSAWQHMPPSSSALPPPRRLWTSIIWDAFEYHCDNGHENSRH